MKRHEIWSRIADSGSPAEAVDPIEVVREFIGLDRMIFMFDLGGIPDENL